MEYQQQQCFVFNFSSSPSTVSTTRRKFTRKMRSDSANNSSSSILVTEKKIPFHGPCDIFNAEKMVQPISSDKAGDLENFILLPDPVLVKTKVKIEENSDAPSNSALPLIPISRVLKGIPQSPHFFQLRRYSELAREKLIAAWDQAFEDTVEQIHDLKSKDFWVNARKLWKTMEDLQGMGYNVIPMRRRLVEMAEVMDELKKWKLEIVTLKNKAEDHRMERSRLQSMVLSLQVRAEREGKSMVQLLHEVDHMEKALPKYDILIANLAMNPFDVDV